MTVFIGADWLDDFFQATIVVDIDMRQLREQVKTARKYIEENPEVSMVELNASDPVEVDGELFEDMEDLAESGYLIPYPHSAYEEKPVNNSGPFSTEYYLRYGRVNVSMHSVYYICSPKYWDVDLSFYVDMEEEE